MNQSEQAATNNPDEVVALGAAVQAGLVERNAAVNDLVVTDVSTFTLGVEVSKEFGHEMKDGFFDPIIDRNTVIPVSRVKRYSTVQPNQSAITVRVYQGESRKTQENLLLGEFDVAGIPPGPKGQGVDIRFTYDLNGVIEVEATVVATKKAVSHVIARQAGEADRVPCRRVEEDEEGVVGGGETGPAGEAAEEVADRHQPQAEGR